MFWDDTPFAARAKFMYDNVMPISEAMQETYSPQQNPGFNAFRELLLSIYAAPDAFSGEDDLERFHALSYSTQLFFSTIAEVGTLVEDGESLKATKADFKKVYKKTDNTPFDVLPRFGVAFLYSKKEKPATSYAGCDAFVVRFSQDSGIAAALKEMTRHFSEVDLKREYAEALVMLGKADYDRLILGRPIMREDIDLLRSDIVNSTGAYRDLYLDIVAQSKKLDLNTSAYIQRYANPTWNINFLRGKKLRLKSIWCEGRNFVHVPVPYPQAERIILGRKEMPPRVQAAIEAFGCVQCGKCKKGAKVDFLKVDNITICNGHGESSTIFMQIESLEEVSSLFEVIASLD